MFRKLICDSCKAPFGKPPKDNCPKRTEHYEIIGTRYPGYDDPNLSHLLKRHYSAQ